MTEKAQYLSEFVCGACAHTGHANWEGTGATRRLIETTEIVQDQAGGVTSFACSHCGTALTVV